MAPSSQRLEPPENPGRFSQVESIALGPPASLDVELTLEEKGLFFPPVTIDETPIKVSCDIYDFNKYENQGHARVNSGQAIPEGSYKFKNIGSQAVEEFIISMTATEVTLSCLIKYEYDPLTEKRISEILVTDVAA